MSDLDAIIARTILQNLGGSRFVAAARVRTMVRRGRTLMIEIPATWTPHGVVTRIDITYCVDDRYTLDAIQADGDSGRVCASTRTTWDELLNSYEQLTGTTINL